MICFWKTNVKERFSAFVDVPHTASTLCRLKFVDSVILGTFDLTVTLPLPRYIHLQKVTFHVYIYAAIATPSHSSWFIQSNSVADFVIRSITWKRNKCVCVCVCVRLKEYVFRDKGDFTVENPSHFLCYIAWDQRRVFPFHTDALYEVRVWITTVKVLKLGRW